MTKAGLSTATTELQQSGRFLILYALAAAGGAVAYVPFLTILLPMRVSELASGNNVQNLAYLTFAGAVTASIANIGFGWLSDVTRNRQKWIWSGLIGCCALLVCFAKVERIEWLIGLLVLWQCALNMMLAPIAAWAGDTVPDSQKGLLGGLLAFSPAMGAVAGAIITIPGLASADSRLWLVAGLTSLCVLPALLFGKPSSMPKLVPSQIDNPSAHQRDPIKRQMILRMWIARLLVQIAEAALFAFLYFWLQSVDSAVNDANTAQLFGIVLVISVPVALLAGRWSDRYQRPFLPLSLSAGISGLGLIAMALSHSTTSAMGSYLIFGIATTVFLSLHTGQTLRVLPLPHRRGRDLGIFNLTNTGPSLVMPWIVIGLVPHAGFPPLLFLLAGFALTASLLLMKLSCATSEAT